MADDYVYNEFVPDVHFELIPIKMLVSNQTYQRPISSAHVGRTAQNFNIYQINPVKVSRRDGAEVTDDCSAVERLGMTVKTVEGDERNLKVTTPLDLKLAEMLMEENA